MTARRKQGQKEDNGITKNQILLFLCEHPEGIGEPEIKDFIKEHLGISEPKGISDHLTGLENKKLLFKKRQPGKANIWSLLQIGFSTLVERFKDSPDFKTFHHSTYCQNIINEEFAEDLIRKWHPVDDEDLKRWSPPKTRIRELPEFSGKVRNLVRILRMSPTALKTALYATPQRGIYNWAFFNIKLLAAVIIDLEAGPSGRPNINHMDDSDSVYGWIKGTVNLQVGIDDNGKYIDETAPINWCWGDVRKVPGFEMPDYFDVSTEEGLQKEKEWKERYGLD